jgi:hypothetical protein
MLKIAERVAIRRGEVIDGDPPKHHGRRSR